MKTMKTTLEKILIFSCINLLILQIPFAQKGMDVSMLQLVHQEGTKHSYLESDMQDMLITNQYTSGGISHTYISQTINNIPIYGATTSVHTKGTKTYISEFSFRHAIQKAVILHEINFNLERSIAQLIVTKNYNSEALVGLNLLDPSLIGNKIKVPLLSVNAIPVDQVYFPVDKTELHLAWKLIIDEVETGNMFEYYIDATNGELLKEISLTLDCFNDSCNHQHTPNNDLYELHFKMPH